MSGVMYDKILGRLRESGDGSGDGSGTPAIYTVDDITTLDSSILDELKTGDIVVETDPTSGYSKAFVVAFYSEDEVTSQKEIWFNVLYSSVIEYVNYGYSEENFAWEYRGRGYEDVAIKANKIFARTTQPVGGMMPNNLYNLGELSASTTFTLAPASDNTVANVWAWTFETGSTVPQIAFPNVIWMDNTDTDKVNNIAVPVVEANKHYEITIMDGYGTINSADVPAPAQNNE